MVRCLDANDVFVSSRGGPSGHFSDATPGLLALAEKYRRGGKELLTCLVASYELQGALAESFDFWDRGGHALTNVGWTVPVVAARLMGTTPVEAAHACGLSVATGKVLNTWLKPGGSMPMIKGAAAGLVLERALESAELAALGVTATQDALETAGADRAVATRLERLGERWTTIRNMIKFYPAQLYTQAAVEAALRLHRRGVRADGVRRLILYGNRSCCGGVQGSAQAFAPETPEAADHSTPYVVAAALLRGRLTPREYEGAPWETDEVKTVMAKIELVHDPEADRALDTHGILGVRLAAILADGRTEEVIVQQPKGHPDAPLSHSELLEKMTSMVESAAPAATPGRLLDICGGLSTPEDIASLIEACRIRRA
jgi:2-methylcitrate dehydratase